MWATNADVFASSRVLAEQDEWGAFDVHAARREDLFDAWVFAADDATRALAAWATSVHDGRDEAHAVYRAALDREEHAAAVLAAAVSS
jgi:hypothetical protein